MEEKKPISHLMAGLIIGAIIVLYSILLNFAGLSTDRSLGWITYLLVIVGLILFINLYAKAKDNQVTFGNLFAYGFKTTAVMTLVFIVFLVIFTLAFPEFKEKIIEASRKEYEKNSSMTNADIEKALDMIRRFYMVGLVGGTLLFMAIIGAIGSLIGAAVTKKKPVNPVDQLDMR